MTCPECPIQICHEGFLLYLLAQDPVLFDHHSGILPSTINPSVDCAPPRIKEECLEPRLDRREIPLQFSRFSRFSCFSRFSSFSSFSSFSPL
ncbi:hypothetical protein EJ02DRAFT_96162 [Clathrospora elynae]|uniref:Uncharacterized protein n=1 Tax=Clathrospora elynae TaxID=706981 RepID=A0A6A5SA27_9PLEO|nr:hypothetical protein EJ02DRAFT_96162 [Clathrospora elynae]